MEFRVELICLEVANCIDETIISFTVDQKQEELLGKKISLSADCEFRIPPNTKHNFIPGKSYDITFNDKER